MRTIYHFLLLLGLLCGVINSHAQMPSSAPSPGSYKFSAYRLSTDGTLLNLDTSPVRSKVLYDRVFPAARLSEWSQTDQSSKGHFTQAQRELHEASYNSHTKNFLPFTK